MIFNVVNHHGWACLYIYKYIVIIRTSNTRWIVYIYFNIKIIVYNEMPNNTIFFMNVWHNNTTYINFNYYLINCIKKKKKTQRTLLVILSQVRIILIIIALILINYIVIQQITHEYTKFRRTMSILYIYILL